MTLSKLVHSTTQATLDDRSRELRRLIVHTLSFSRRGHLGAAFSLVEILRVLYDDILRVDPNQPRWPLRDKCILSKGHGCLALYTVLADKGFFLKDELKKFCQPGGILGGHPEYGKIPGIEASTGSLGHGLAIGVGFALSARMENRGSRVFVIMGDGECNEGSVWEAALCAGKHQLDNLTVLVDYNKQQSYSRTQEVLDLEPFLDKWRSFGFAATDVDGHSVDPLKSVLSSLPLQANQPSAILCHTIKGRGIPFTEQNLEWHHKNRLTDEEISQLYAALEDGP